MENSSARYDGWVKKLIGFCIALVVFIILWVVIDTIINICYHSNVKKKLDKIEYLAIDAIDFSDSTAVYEGKVLTGKDIKDLLDQRITMESTIVDSNNYLAIILTLITLCVSLSVVIPYVVGRAVSSKDIKDRVDELYAFHKDDVAVKFRSSVNMLLASEAHQARMIAYELLCGYYNRPHQVIRPKPCCCCKCIKGLTVKIPLIPAEYSIDKHPIWALGWASKALFRYVVIGKTSYKNFCEDLVKYILSCMSEIGLNTAIIDANKAMATRAFYDLFNALVYNKTMSNNIIEGNNVKSMTDALNGLAPLIFVDTTIDTIVSGAKDTAHCDQYLDSDIKKSNYLDNAVEQAKEVFSYMKNPNPTV